MLTPYKKGGGGGGGGGDGGGGGGESHYEDTKQSVFLMNIHKDNLIDAT